MPELGEDFDELKGTGSDWNNEMMMKDRYVLDDYQFDSYFKVGQVIPNDGVLILIASIRVRRRWIPIIDWQ